MSDPDTLIKVITHYQQALEHYAKKKNDAKMLHCIFKLSHMPITRKHLEETGVGRTVNSLRRLDEVGEAARALVTKWKDMVSKQEEDDEEEGEEEVQNIKSGTSKDVAKKSGQRDKTEDNRSNSSHRNSDKNSDKGDRHSVHKKEKHKEGSHSSKGNHISSSQKVHRERHSKERRRSYERHSENDDSEESHSDKKKSYKAHIASKGDDSSDSDRSASYESPPDRIASNSDEESDSDGNSKYIRSNKVESKETEKLHSKGKQSSSNNGNRRSYESNRRDRSNSKERRRSKSKEKSRDKKLKEETKSKDWKRDSTKRKRECSDSSDSEQAYKKHESRESSKRKHYDSSSDSDSSQQIHVKEMSDDENYRASPRKDANRKDGERKEKERKESHRSGSHHSGSKSEGKRHSEKEKNGDNKRKEKASKDFAKNDKKSKRESKSQSTSSISKEIIATENGICSSYGASFADALGMLEPTTSKGVKKSKPPHMTTSSTPEKTKSEKYPDKKLQLKSDVPLLKSDVLLPPLSPKLESVDIDISSLLPPITPNYRPLGNYVDSAQNLRNKILNEDEALCMVMSSKNQRTKVYSGNKIMWNTVPSLFELCTRILQDNIDALEYTGGVPYCILKPVLDKATPDQLFVLEHHNPYLMEDTDELWQFHCQKEFRNKQREEMETWREMYMRCLDEREAKLKTLKANIKQSQEKSTPVRKTQLAYIDSVVKPPRNVLKKQIKSGTDTRPAITPASRLTALATAGAAGQITVPNPGSRASSSGSSSSAHMKPKKAPLMQKTLQFLKGGRFRR